MEMAAGLESDLSQLDDLTVNTILGRLKGRYERDLIYTKVSDILIGINPCRPLPIYDTKHHDLYQWNNFSTDTEPHIFNVAATAYRRMRETDTNQVVIVSGESGAGKTENTKYMVRHMVHMCEKGNMELHDKIVKVNPLLESFGNAKTVMNRNSSRFAKYLELSFQAHGQLCGAVIRDYMLEKSRVVHQSQGEGIFHIFYALFAGCSKSKRESLYLGHPPGVYRIMQSDSDSLDMEQHYRELYKENMDILQKINVDTEVLHVMLAAVVNLTEIEFIESDKGHAEIEDAAPYIHAAILLDLDEKTFGHALIASSTEIRGQVIGTYKSVKQARDSRDALAKMLYERMFQWLVKSINDDLHPNRRGSSITTNIGILDIAGFEKLHKNSFEQLCINVVNEKLQNFMNERVFTIELEIYKQEGIQLGGIEFKNNEDTLLLFQQPKVGLLDMLDEVTMFQQGTDAAFVQQLNSRYKDNPLYTAVKGDRPEFGINHFASQVWYDANGFLEKNRDRLTDEMLTCMKQSKDDFISDLFTVKRGPTGTISLQPHVYRASRHVAAPPKATRPTPKGQLLAMQLGKSLKKRFGTVHPPIEEGITRVSQKVEHNTMTSYFKASLLDLLDKLRGSDQFFVRCLKANNALAPSVFDDVMVGDQLNYNGIAEIAKIRKMGLPTRLLYTDFADRYRVLHPKLSGNETKKAQTQKIMLSMPAAFHRDFRCGKTMVFMTEEVDMWLKRLLQLRESAAARKITNCVRLVGRAKRKQREDEERKRKEAERIKREQIQRKRKKEEEEKKRPERESNKQGSQMVLPSSARSSVYGPTDPPYDRVPPQKQAPQQLKQQAPPPPYEPLAGTSQDFDEVPPISVARPPSPVKHHTDDDDDDDSDDEKSGQKSKKVEVEFWDICQVIARERESKDVHEQRSLQVIKAVTYFLVFCIVLWCSVSQKISLMVLASYQYDRGANRTISEAQEDHVIETSRHILITIAIVIPYGLTLLSSVLKWIFGGFYFPCKSTLIVAFLTEGLHTVGICILCYRILPELDMARGIMLLSGVAILPSFLKPFCTSDTKVKNASRSVKCASKMGICVMDIVALIFQCAFIPGVILTDYFLDVSETESDLIHIIEFVAALFLISLSWWENFMDDRLCGRLRVGSMYSNFLLSMKFDLQESRPIVSVFMSIWKMALTIFLAWAFRQDLSDYINDAFTKLADQDLAMNSSILTLTLAAVVGNYAAYTACKLQLQGASFTLPLVISTPIAVGLVVLDCEYPILGPFTDERRECADDYMTNGYHFLFGAALWVSVYWIGRHIFSPNSERLAKTERLFLNPYYCSILFEQHMVLNRRRHNRKVHREFKEDKISFRLSKHDTRVSVEGEEVENMDNASDDVYRDDYKNPKFRDVPMIYACATMWHENRLEMLQLMKSIFRMDRDQCLRKHAEIFADKEDEDFYDFEAHILFDDAMELNDNEDMEPNQFVKQFMAVINESVSCVYHKQMNLKPPYKVPSPYGGQLIWQMPGDNFLFLHMKDKQKIRHRKRWSQVMYMYYLLGFRIVRLCQETVTAALNENKLNDLGNWGEGAKTSAGNIGKGQIFQIFDEQVIRKASNTFLLALDGDVDFSPGAVRLLLDRMRKSETVGAACGRIHPIGTGPIVWFQKFEYAIAHWLQKATEHVLGCVLCSPGCFSLFRGSALMDDNIMKKYTLLPTSPIHHLMYDQGEDRWLCTLLLQQGYRVDYAAGSDAFTYAPEGFGEFFNQRRRWMPSTVANIIDLLADYKNTVYANKNISMLYIFYQASLLVSTMVGPATVLMMIAGANLIVFKVNLWNAYLIALVPAIVYFLICFIMKPKWQILVAEVMTAFYAFVMMIVFVGTVVTAAQESPFHPSVLFIAVLVFMFAFAAILHPKEWTCVIYGLLYFLCIPTGFLLLIFYSLCNMNNISWGTREIARKKTKEEIEAEQKKLEEKKKRKERGIIGRFLPKSPLKDLKEIISKITDMQSTKKQHMDEGETTKLLKEISSGITKLVEQKDTGAVPKVPLKPGTSVKDPVPQPEPQVEGKGKGILKRPGVSVRKSVGIAEKVTSIDMSGSTKEEDVYDKVKKRRDEMVNPAWIECKDLGHGDVMPMFEEEANFWNGFIKKYLEPLTLTAEQKKSTAKGLVELRNNVSLGMAMINLMWIAINFMFQLEKPTKITIMSTSTGGDGTEEDEADESTDELVSVDPLGLLFIIFFVLILLLQFVGMIMHRWGTFLHLVSVTQLRNPLAGFGQRRPDEESGEVKIDSREAREIVDDLLREPLPDYYESDEDPELEAKQTKEELRHLQTTGSRFGVSLGRTNILGASSRQFGMVAHTDTERSKLLRGSAKIIAAGLKASRRRLDRAPEHETLQRDLQDAYRKQKDSRYKDRELPPIKVGKFNKLNLAPGRAGLKSILRERHMSEKYHMDDDFKPKGGANGPLVPEEDDDDIYDVIPRKGTVGRQIGKRMKLIARKREQNGRPRSVLFDVPDAEHNRPHNKRPNSYEMY